MAKRKVIFVYDAIYPYIKGGAERRFYELGKRLVKKNVEVHLFGMKLWSGPNVIEREGMVLHGISKARPMYTKNGRRSIKQALIFGLSTFRIIFMDFDVIDCCGFPFFSLFPCKFISLVRKKPLYSTWHEVWGRDYWISYLGNLGYLGFMVEKLAARLPSEFLTGMNDIEKRLKSELKVNQKIHVVGNGIDHKYICSVKASELKSDIIYAGRLVEFKHVNLLIDVVNNFRRKGKNITCNIIGDGPEFGTLKKLVQELKLTQQVNLLGFIDDSQDVYRIMKASKVFILPSSREGFGMVAIEANACGLPVVTVNEPHNAAKSLIKDGVNGSIVRLNANDISLATQVWLSQKHRSYYEHVRPFDWDIITKNIVGIYFQ